MGAAGDWLEVRWVAAAGGILAVHWMAGESNGLEVCWMTGESNWLDLHSFAGEGNWSEEWQEQHLVHADLKYQFHFCLYKTFCVYKMYIDASGTDRELLGSPISSFLIILVEITDSSSATNSVSESFIIFSISASSMLLNESSNAKNQRIYRDM